MSGKQDYKIMVNSEIPPELRGGNPGEELNYNPVNGGLYGGPQCKRSWMPQHVTPTATNLIMNNLASANPPPGAIEQYIGTNRPGNNYTAMPDIYWFKTQGKGPHNLKVTH